MSDISAVVLSIGESYTERAIKSLEGQTLSPKEVILIENVAPFHKAFNAGAEKVKTEFFVQIDSDMIPDPNCFQDLYNCMQPEVGIAVGHLRDPLVGRTVGIKMFRLAVFGKITLGDKIASETDFRENILENGWHTIYPLRFEGDREKEWHSFGQHRPDYTPNYTYCKYLMEGKKYVYRKDVGGLRARFCKLQNSQHSQALLAQIALANGLFLKEECDLLQPFTSNKDHDVLNKFFNTNGNFDAEKVALSELANLNHKQVFEKFYELGHTCRELNSFKTFKRCLADLCHLPIEITWVAKVALCRGLFSNQFDATQIREDFRIIIKLVNT